MNQYSIYSLMLVLMLFGLSACESSDSDYGLASENGESMSIEGVSMLNDIFVWNTFVRDAESEPVNVDNVVLNTRD